MPASDSPVPQPSAAPVPWRLFGLPVVVWLSLQPFAAALSDPSAAAETRFLALLAAAAVACLAVLAPRRPIAEATAVACLAILWCVHHGTARGTLVCTVLILGFAVAASLRWQSSAGDPSFFIALATGWQLLTRPDLLLPPLLDARTLVSLALLPALAGVALAILAARYGRRRALLAAMAAAVPAPGFNVTVTATLVAIAAGQLALDAGGPRRAWMRGLGATGFLGAVAVSWPLTPVVVAAGLLPMVQRARRGAVPAMIAGLVGAAAAFALLTAGSEQLRPSAHAAFAALCLLPAAWLAPVARSAPGLAFVAAAVLLRPDPEAAVAGLVWLALSIPQDLRGIQLQMGLPATCGLGLLAGYPWLEADPLRRLAPSLEVAAGVLLALVAFTAALRLLNRRVPAPPGLLAWTAASLLLLAAAPRPPVAVFERPHALLPDQEATIFPLAEGVKDISALVVETSLVHGTGLEVGTPVARLDVHGADGERLASAQLLAGEHTADWAVGRPDVAARITFPPPRPWSYSLAADGSFFAQRFRTHLPAAAEAAEIRVVRPGELPQNTQVLLHRLELRP